MVNHLLGVAGIALFFAGCHTNVAPQKVPITDAVTIVAGGDVVWSQRVRHPDYYFGSEKNSEIFSNDGWRRLPYLATPEARDVLEKKFEREFETDAAHFKTAQQYELVFENEKARLTYPFEKIAQQLQNADLAFVNLESPLSDNGRLSGAFRVPLAFARPMADAGIDIVSTANNHAFDAEGQGITDTLKALQSVGIKAVGTGENIDAASDAEIIDIKGEKIAFLAFTYGVNPTRTSLGFATQERSGAAPLDPFLMKRKIESASEIADVVIVSLHWGLENRSDVHPSARKMARDIVDWGADVILGHHPHLPRGVEVYHDSLIVYSLGNLIFGHGHVNWEDNFLIEIVISSGEIKSAKMIPVSGTKQDITQPYVLSGTRAVATLKTLKNRSEHLSTEVTILNDRGIIKLKN